MKQPKRLAWIDYVKVFAIFFVVLVHVDCSPLCTKVLKAFLMPLFFILSGYLFSYERNPKYKPFALKRFRQIIIPYAWISAVTYLLWFFVLRKFGNNPNDAVAWYVPVAGTFAGMPPLLVHDIPLWSLVSFFVVEMIYYPLRKCLKSDIGIAAIAFLTAWGISSLLPDISLTCLCTRSVNCRTWFLCIGTALAYPCDTYRFRKRQVKSCRIGSIDCVCNFIEIQCGFLFLQRALWDFSAIPDFRRLRGMAHDMVLQSGFCRKVRAWTDTLHIHRHTSGLWFSFDYPRTD